MALFRVSVCERAVSQKNPHFHYDILQCIEVRVLENTYGTKNEKKKLYAELCARVKNKQESNRLCTPCVRAASPIRPPFVLYYAPVVDGGVFIFAPCIHISRSSQSRIGT